MTFEIRNINDSLNEFYSGSSIFVPNKFMVYLDGPYVTQAIKNLDAIVDGLSNEYESDKINYNRWRRLHVASRTVGSDQRYATISPSGDNRGSIVTKETNGQTVKAKVEKEYRINFLWSCQDINIPLPNIETDEMESRSMTLDPIKNLKYTMITNYSMNYNVSMGVLEEKGMVWGQFFNELSNLFYDAKILTPRDSIRKLRVVVDIIASRDMPSSSERTSEFELISKFEFNSAVLASRDDLKFGNSIEEGMKGSVTFKIPNPFQASYNHEESGLQNRISDDSCISRGQIAYNSDTFEGDHAMKFVMDYENFISGTGGSE